MGKIIDVIQTPYYYTQQVQVQCEEEEGFKVLCDYYNAHIGFMAHEFLGLTCAEAIEMMRKKNHKINGGNEVARLFLTDPDADT